MRRVGLDRRAVAAAEQAQKDATLPADEPFHPLPAPVGAAPYRLGLASVVPNLGGTRCFHVVGDTGGIVTPVPQQHVVAAMIADLAVAAGPASVPPQFAYHVGDWAYFEGERQAWVTQVFEAYERYTRPLMGIPGNHDSFDFENWVRYMCARSPGLLPEIAEFHRDTMDQPNAYWTLEDDLMTIIGLATNVPSGGVVEADQAQWLAGELEAAPVGRALMVALHHPPYSVDAHHGGSVAMGKVLDEAFRLAKRVPDLVLSGHVHNYQRFSREGLLPFGAPLTYVVAGAGGFHNLHQLTGDAKAGAEVAPGVVINTAEAQRYGFLRIEVLPAVDDVSWPMIVGTYTAVDLQGATEVIDRFKISVR